MKTKHGVIYLAQKYYNPLTFEPEVVPPFLDIKRDHLAVSQSTAKDRIFTRGFVIFLAVSVIVLTVVFAMLFNASANRATGKYDQNPVHQK